MAGLSKELAGYKIPKGSYFDQDEDDDRLDTLENDDYDYDDMNYKEENPIEVDMEKIRDDEDMDMESRFKVGRNYCENAVLSLDKTFFYNKYKKKNWVWD